MALDGSAHWEEVGSIPVTDATTPADSATFGANIGQLLKQKIPADELAKIIAKNKTTTKTGSSDGGAS
jgi:hypothetical protein